MSVLTLSNDEFKAFPPIIREYASYVAAIKGNSERTVCEYLLDLRTFFRFYLVKKEGKEPSDTDFEKISISGITLEDIKQVDSQFIVDFLMYAGFQRKNSTTTRMRKLSALKSFYKFLHSKRHYIDKNPTLDIDAPKKAQTLPKYMNVDEAVRLLEAVKADTESKTQDRDFAIITLFLNTGMRLSELVGLNIQSFPSDLEKVTVLGKGNKQRVVYLNAAARSAVKAYLRTRLDPRYVRTSDSAMFLSKRQTRISTKTVQWIIYKYLERAGLSSKRLSVHKLRHTAATLMYQSGKVDIRVLKDILGHEQLNTTQIYTHVVSRNIEDAVDSNPLSDIKISPQIKEKK
ncbi:MAG: tyrosine recombinase XerC [Clostridia bacterium]|nr:tyrosine recombinase XerC [Clostridia bacterium]